MYIYSRLPFTLPGALGNLVKRWIQTVDVIADVTHVAQDESTLVVRLTTTLAHRAVQAAPALLQNHS